MANITAKTNALFLDAENHVCFKVTPYSFWVTIDNAKNHTKELPDNLRSEAESKLVAYMMENKNASISEIVAAMGLSKTTISLKIQQLKNKNVLENKGTTRKNIWVIK